MEKMLTIEDLITTRTETLEEVPGAIRELANFLEYAISKDDSPRPNPGGIHASEFYGCRRRVVYSILNTPRSKEVPNVWRKRFGVGHAIHGYLQGLLHKSVSVSPENSPYTIDFQDEVAISPEKQEIAKKWSIYSHCDGVISMYRKQENNPFLQAIVEIKTESPDSFEKLTKPKVGHIYQAHFYMACLDVPLTWFLYWNKGNQNYTAPDGKFLIEFDPILWAQIEVTMGELHAAAKANELPPKEESMVCEFCSFRETCQPSYGNRVSKYQHVIDPRLKKTIKKERA